ncbi:hypothetical protein BBO01nite_23010 [Brevibacillus borstelensis]|nr:hypothetical protein BBO01nite_23010 [Brevibacillus borstelensis]
MSKEPVSTYSIELKGMYQWNIGNFEIFAIHLWQKPKLSSVAIDFISHGMYPLIYSVGKHSD